MTEKDARATIAFLERAEGLKDTRRSAFTAAGRSEDAAAHSWRLCLWLVVFADAFEGVDMARALRMAVVHDLGEVVSGDIPAIRQSGDKSAEERIDFLSLLDGLPTSRAQDMTGLWDEYEAGQTPEARVVKALDKMETILQHTQGQNPPDFDHAFNLSYGAKWAEGDPVLAQLRKIIDAKTQALVDVGTD